jgi:hypothetical protein
VSIIAAETCNWTVTASAAWINITTNDNGTGNDVVTFEARENLTGSTGQMYLFQKGSASLYAWS